MHSTESPIAIAPVTSGSPSTTMSRQRLSSPAITWTSGVIGSARPSSQGPATVSWRAHASKTAGSARVRRSSTSSVGVASVTENVRLSPTNTPYLR